MDPFMGEVKLFGFGFAPKGYALCNGQTMAIAQNQALFSLLGTTYGGNGVQTFALPNVQGRTPVHFNGNVPQGSLLGNETVTLTIPEMPAHNHAMYGTGGTANRRPAAAHTFANDTSPAADFYAPPGPLVTLGPQALAPLGGSQPHDNMQPYLVMNYCIALQGFYPSRN